MFCTRCGKAIDPGAQFCAECGLAIALERKASVVTMAPGTNKPVSANRILILAAVATVLVLVATTFSDKGPSQPGAAPSSATVRENAKDGLTYVWIPPGRFQMGCSPGDDECRENEKPAHEVVIANGFWMGQTKVLQTAYKRVMGHALWNTAGWNSGANEGDRRPVVTSFLDEAEAYCQAVGMRLPTEEEWEYAARAGSTASRYGDLDQIAWNHENNGSGDVLKDVGQKLPNVWGLYDMLGLVQEWTASTDDEGRQVIRGSWDSYLPMYVRVSCRTPVEHTMMYGGRIPGLAGFRCAGELVQN